MSFKSPPPTDLGVNPRIFPGKPAFELPSLTTHTPNATADNNVIVEAPRLCAPFPPCDPLGCGDWNVAPIECEGCNSTAVAFTVVGMCVLAFLIVIANLLVVLIISRTVTLQRRHGYIKVSLAVSDLLIGLLVLPSAIYNLTTHLYLPPQFRNPERSLEKWTQTNSAASVFFGTVLVISIVSSLYNLLLLSLDRFLAVFRPLQNRSGKYFSRRRLGICISIVWMLGLLVSSLPAMLSHKFTYVMDGTTFFYVQSTVANAPKENGAGPIALFSLVVMGIPYILTVVLNIVTLFITFRRLAVRQRIGSVSSLSRSKKEQRSEEARRLKKILDTCPEMQHPNSSKSGFFASGWCKSKNHTHNNSHTDSTPGRLSSDRLESANLSFKKGLRRPASLNYRVTRMILSMVITFTVCICPYVVVNVMLVNGELNCDNVGTVYNIAIYLVISNSFANFCLYNLWHREFRQELIAVLKCLPKRKQPRKTSNGITSSRQSHQQQWSAFKEKHKPLSSNYSSGFSSFQQPK